MQSESQAPSAQRPEEPKLFWTSHQVHRGQPCVNADIDSRMNAQSNSPFTRRSLLSRSAASHRHWSLNIRILHEDCCKPAVGDAIVQPILQQGTFCASDRYYCNAKFARTLLLKTQPPLRLRAVDLANFTNPKHQRGDILPMFSTRKASLALFEVAFLWSSFHGQRSYSS